MTSQPDNLITSLTNPRVKQVVKWRKPRERRRDGVLLAEGQREVERAFAAGLEVSELYLCDAILRADISDTIRGFAEFSPRLKVEQIESCVVRVNNEVMHKIAYHDKPEGVLGVFVEPSWSLDSLTTTSDALYLVAVGTEKPGNLGAMVRTAAAAGCDAVLAVGPSVDVFNPNAIRNSTGAVFSLPTLVVENDDDAIAWLRSRGVKIAATLASDDAVSLHQADLAGPLAIVIGPEHAGLNDAWRDAADVCLHIPMAESVVDSLNASTAAAVSLFEARRQRGG